MVVFWVRISLYFLVPYKDEKIAKFHRNFEYWSPSKRQMVEKCWLVDFSAFSAIFGVYCFFHQFFGKFLIFSVS